MCDVKIRVARLGEGGVVSARGSLGSVGQCLVLKRDLVTPVSLRYQPESATKLIRETALYDVGVPSSRPTIYLHVGAPKTGTTYLQDVLWQNRRQLARTGVSIPGSGLIDHFRAALDLRDIKFRGYDDPAVPGAWQRLSDKALAGTGKVVISHELLAAATEEQVHRVAVTLPDSELHVIYGVRDVARQLPAVWQETLKNRQTRTYEKFLHGALKAQPETRASSRFWQLQDTLGTLQRWSSVVPTKRIHAITLPQPGAPPDTLWKRFCQALGVAPDGYDLEVARSNASMTLQDAEVLRLLNQALPEDLPWPTYERIIKRRFNMRGSDSRQGDPILVPSRHREAVMALAERTRSGLAVSGYDVIGDLDDLLPPDSSFGAPESLTPDSVTLAAVAVLADIVVEGAQSSSGPREAARILWGQLRRGRGAR